MITKSFRILVFLFFILTGMNVTAQELSSNNKRAILLFHTSDEFIKRRDFEGAKDQLYQAIEKDPGFVEAYLKLGSIHKLFQDNEKAKKCFQKAADLKPNSKELAGAYYTLADIYFNERNYETAKKYFDMTIAVNPDDKDLLEKAKRNGGSCLFAIDAMKHPLDFKPVMMDKTINNFYAQAYPILTADQQTMIYYVIRTGDRNAKGDIMVSKKENGVWSHPVSISDNINSEADEGAPSLSSDGKTLVFAACNRPDAIGGCDIYISYKEGEEWSKPINLGSSVNSSTWDSEPSVTADGKAVYFSSERKGGIGKRDIWFSRMNDKGEWSKAQNLGDVVNTKGDEVSPFIHANGTTLYFSSNYLPGMGGYDIFYTKRKDSIWETPKNIGYPVNTSDHDGTFFITADSKKGYYSVYEKKVMINPPAYIHEFDVPVEIQEKNKSTYAKGTVYDAVTKNKIGAKIELIDLKSNQVIQSLSSDKINGDYLLVLTEGSEYALYISKEGYLFKSIFFDYKTPSVFNPLTLDIYLDPVKQGASVVLNNIFFPTNSYELEGKSKTELDKIILFLKSNPKVSIEFGGHTDDVGSDQANMELSQKRAKAVYDYLVKAGVDAVKLKYKGYGETKPITPNTSDENRAKNRRIEFKIL